MMAFHTLLLFAATELLFSATPGPAVMMVSAHGFRGGFGAAMAANLGILTGNAVYVVISALGLGALIAASATAFTVIKIAGAGYLVFLGVRTLWHAGKADDETKAAARPYRQAVFTQLSNPKAMLYFGSFLPQFLDPGKLLVTQYAEMFLVICIGETLILGGYGFLASRGARIAGARFRLWRDRISGAVFIVIGVLFATAHRV